MGQDCYTYKKIILVATVLALFPRQAFGQEIQVCSTCGVKTIKEAVMSAPPGTTILVAEGVYREHDVLIDKPLRIAAQSGRPIVDGERSGNVFLVQANRVEISGLLIRNSGFSHVEDLAGIKVMDSADCLLNNNILESNYFGIYLGHSQKCTISGNTVTGLNTSEANAGNGIHIWYGNHMRVTGNDTTQNRDGIYFEFVTNSAIQNNRSHGNLRYGLHFMFSNDNEYIENEFTSNDSGVAVMYSRRIKMIKNHFTGSHGGASYGLLLKDISDSVLNGNIFEDNTIGAYIEGTARCQIESNTFYANGWALRVLGNTDSNNFLKNDFVGNTFDVSTNATLNQNNFSENYWSHYRGLDLNHDGIGDTPYHPVQLSTMLMEQYKTSVLLIQSFFFKLLDEVEEVLPILTPEAFKDNKPRMKQWSKYD